MIELQIKTRTIIREDPCTLEIIREPEGFTYILTFNQREIIAFSLSDFLKEVKILMDKISSLVKKMGKEEETWLN